MNFRNLTIGAVAILSLAACSKQKANPNSAAALSAPALEDNGATAYAAGTPNIIYSVASSAMTIDGTAVEEVNDSTFAGFPMLASQFKELQTTEKVIETKESALEIWSADAVVLAFDLRSGTPSLLHSRSGSFQVESLTYTKDAAGQGQGQGLQNATLSLTMRECMAQKEQQKEQEQEKGKQEQEKGKQEQEKGKEQGQGQQQKKLASDTSGQGQGQGQEQKQEEKKEQAKPAEVCKVVVITARLSEVAQPKQEQEKGKQEQEQGKQEQEKGKQEQEKGKQEQEKGKQEQEKGKQEQEKGKQEQEKGKQEQEKPKQDQGQDQGKK